MNRKRVFKTRHFAKFAAKAGLTDIVLCQAVIEMEQGLVDADLGGGVVKKRVPLPGKGKSGSSRTIVAHHQKSHWFFVYGFEKSHRANITTREIAALQKMAVTLFAYADVDLDDLVVGKNLLEICDDGEYKKGRQPTAGGIA